MTLDKILAISGKPGLYELKSQTRNGFVVESLSDGKRVTVLSARNDISVLSEIAIYTLKEEMPLSAVFQKIKDKEGGEKTTINHKASTIALEEYFFEIVPDYDEDRVYPNHIKKVIQWYNLLQEKGISFDEEKDNDTKKEEATEE